MGLTAREEQLSLCIGGILHDIGKTKLPLELLNKKAPLTAKEKELTKSHVTIGVDMLLKANCDVPFTTIIITSQHHEQVNGSGYPEGLQGKGFHHLGRMASIVDGFSALTDTRTYRPALPKEVALRKMLDSEGVYDYHLLKEFRDIVVNLT